MKYSIITKTAAFILAVLTLSASILTFVVTALYSDFIDPYYDSEYSDVMLYALRNDANNISQLLYIKSEIDEGTGISAEYEQEYDRLLEKYGDADSTNVRWIISVSDGANVIGGNTDSFPNFYNSYVITMHNSSYSLSFEIIEMNIDELIDSLGDDDFISCSTSRDYYSAETVENEVTTYMDDTAYETDAEDGSEYIDYTGRAYAYEAYLAGFDNWYYPLEYIDFYLENYEEWYFSTDIPFADENGNTSVLVISDGGRTEYYVPTIDTVLCTMEVSGYIFTYSTATDTWNYESVLPEYLGLTDDEVLYVWIDENLSVKDDYYHIYSDILSPIESFADSLALPVILSCLVISILLFIYCAAVSGVAENTVRGEDGTTHRVRCPHPAWINRIPFDVFFVLCALISCVGIIPILMTADGEIHPTATLIYITGNAPLVYTVSFLCVFAVVAAAAGIILSIIARVRNGSLIKNNAVVIIVRWTAKKIAQAAAFISGTVPLIWQVGAASAIYV
ncbi:MAG: hypothetical protein LUH54_00335, partial [Firmicutes bacterium]|nr:hypothetical protein [Bacillota bacterium]